MTNKNAHPEILEERRADWGDPVSTHERIALVWSGILGTKVTPHQVALCMVGMKLVRADLNPNNLDSLVDVEGYTSIAQQIQARGQETPSQASPEFDVWAVMGDSRD